MISILLDEKIKRFEQDVRELLMAFFPGEPFCFTEHPDALFALLGTAECFSVSVHSELTPSKPLTEPLKLTGERSADKSEAKRALYRLLVRFTGRTLPWGTLTGIRPVKLAEQQLAAGKADAEVSAFVRDFYLVSEEKNALMLDIAHREREVLSRIPYKEGWSLYVGIPFCPTTCMYCSFTSYPIERWSARVDEYLSCLSRELSQLRALQKEGSEEADHGTAQRNAISGKPLQTVYVGGGTPTALSAEQLDKLLTIMETELDLSTVREFTVESGRPDSITAEKLAVLRAHGVERISINPQTMNQKTLDLIGRRHTTRQVEEAFQLAREAGFENINMDLIMGLPRETEEDVRYTLSKIEEMHPDSLTVHALAVKRAARLNTEGNAWSNLPRAGIDEAIHMTALGQQSAERMGLLPYYLYRQKNMAGNQENIGYAAPGKENLYNILMMEERHTVIGCGAGSSSKVLIENADPARYGGNAYRVERFENIKNIAEYLPRIDELLEKRERFLREAATG